MVKRKEREQSSRKKPLRTKTNWCMSVRACLKSSRQFSLSHSLLSDSFDNNIIDSNTFFCERLITTEIHSRTKHMQPWMPKLIYPLFHLFCFCSFLLVFLFLYIEHTKMDCLLTAMESMMPKFKMRKKPWNVCVCVCITRRHDNAITIEQPHSECVVCLFAENEKLIEAINAIRKICFKKKIAWFCHCKCHWQTYKCRQDDRKMTMWTCYNKWSAEIFCSRHTILLRIVNRMVKRNNNSIITIQLR